MAHKNVGGGEFSASGVYPKWVKSKRRRETESWLLQWPATHCKQRGSRAMHDLLVNNIKLARKVLTRNLLKSLMDAGVGTNEVESAVNSVCRQNVRKVRNKTL